VTTRNLVFRAGPGALEAVRRDGFAAERIGSIAGASGGAKWLVLSQLDRAIASCVLPVLKEPVHLVGTSIGAWRFACYAQADPLDAIERFEDAYIYQSYSEKPDIHEITSRSREILKVLLGDTGAGEILDHPVLRTHILAVRARHIAAFEQRWILGAALAAAASLNAVSRRTLGLFFERVLFFDARDLPPFFDVDDFPLQRVRIGVDNLDDAIVATGSIPLVLSGVRDIPRAMPGVYRDGGVIDYHLDLPHGDGDRLTLYPHFFGRITPGWFDKRLPWRRADPANTDRTILVCPSPEFVARLPNGKIPDRFDFRRYAPSERIRVWRQVVAECRALADEFVDLIENGGIGGRLEPL
jgi:hypothetical protein